MIKYNLKRGLWTGFVFALIGFLFPVMVFFMAHDPTSRQVLFIPCMPAEYILGHFMTMTTWEMAHGGVMYIPFVNTLLYGILGCVLGTLSDVRRYALLCCVIIVIVAVVSQSIIKTKEFNQQNQFIEEMKAGHEQRLKTDPNDVHSLLWMGSHHFSRTQNNREAKGYFEKVMTLVPPEKHSEGYVRSTMLYLVIILKSEGQVEQAKQMYARFLATQPDLTKNLQLFNLNNMARTKLGLPQEAWKPQQ